MSYVPVEGGIVDLAIKAIRAAGSMRSSEIARAVGCLEKSVSSSLARAVTQGILLSCTVQKEDGRIENEYRIGAGMPDRFEPLKHRKVHFIRPARTEDASEYRYPVAPPPSVDHTREEADAAVARIEAPAIPAQPAQTPSIVPAGALPAAQPEVACNTGSTRTEDPTRSPPAGPGAARRTPSSPVVATGLEAMSESSVFVRPRRPSFVLYDQGDVCIASGDAIILLSKTDAKRLWQLLDAVIPVIEAEEQ